MTTLAVDGDVSVEDRATECLTAIARTYQDGIDHLAFLAHAWDAPPALSAPLLLAAALAEPIAAAEPTAAKPTAAKPTAEPVAPERTELIVVEAAAAAPAVEPAAEPVVLLADEPAMVPLDVADLETATDLPAATVAGPATDQQATRDDAVDEVVEQVRVLMFAEAVTAEIPVQAAA